MLSLAKCLSAHCFLHLNRMALRRLTNLLSRRYHQILKRFQWHKRRRFQGLPSRVPPFLRYSKSYCDPRSMPLAVAQSPSEACGMAENDSNDFRIRIARSRDRGARTATRSKSFTNQVQLAIRRAGCNPKRIGGAAGKGGGRFNARGRGAVNSHPTATPFSRPIATPLAHRIWAYPCSA
jgi:hypothetical protein